MYSKVAKNFASRDQFENLDRAQNDQGRDLLNLSKQIATQTVEFNKLTESNKLYERILGKSETDAPDRLSRLVMSSDIFQTEVGRYVTDDNNLIVNSMTMDKNTLVGNNNPNASVSVSDGVFTIKAQGLTSYNWTGFTLPIYVKKIYHGETYTLGFKYRIREYPDVSFAFNIKNHGLNKTLTWANIGENRPPLNEWQEFQKTFTMQEDFAFGEDKNYPFYIYLAKNGWIEFKEPILVRGSNTGPYKPSQFDDVFADNNAVRTQVSQLAGSWAVRNLNSAGDVIGQINLNKDGTVKINEGLLVIGEKTIIKNGVIKDGMIESLGAGKITAGTIDANDVNIVNLNAKSVTSGTFRGLTFEGGIIRGNNGNTVIDLNNNVTTYNGYAKIEFMSPQNSLEYNAGGCKAFLAPTVSNLGNYAAFAFGVNASGSGDPNANFTGIKIFNQPGARMVVLIGDVHIVKDSVSRNAPSKTLAQMFNDINDNFKRLREFRVANGEGAPGFWDVSL
ncbi:hypothetical protein DW052_03305 [Streptococcus parasanguinis]|nr:hypothetical protein DW052_03305 [Streptococcus parasanguinis]